MSDNVRRIWRCAGIATMIVATAYTAATCAAQANRAPANPAPPNQRQLNRAQPNQPRSAAPEGVPQRVTANRPIDGARNTDQVIADWLAICNEEEIALAKIAGSKLQNKDVRSFADKLVKEHDNFLMQLERFGVRPVRLDATNDNRDGEAPRANAPAAARTAVGIQGAGRDFDFLSAMQQIAQRCVANAQQKWGEKKEHERDMAFVGTQLVAHERMLQTERVLRQYASPELQAAIDKAIQTTESHLHQAKDLIHSLAANERDSKRDSNQ